MSTHAGRGTAWEALIEQHARRYAATGRAIVLRTPPPVRLLGRLPGGHWRAVMTADGPPDYAMLIARESLPPVPVLCEAKHNQSGRWPLAQIHPHQAAALLRWQQLGGLAAVLLGHAPSAAGYALSWTRLGPLWSRWRAGQLAGRRAPARSASLDEAAMASLGEAFSWDAGYADALLAAAARDGI